MYFWLHPAPLGLSCHFRFFGHKLFQQKRVLPRCCLTSSKMLSASPYTRCVRIRPIEDDTLFLEEENRVVKLKPFANSSKQVWKLVCCGLGKYLLVNHFSGAVMSVEPDPKPGRKVITLDYCGDTAQQWNINNDDTIVSDSLAMDVFEKKLQPGNVIVVSPYVYERGQRFVLATVRSGGPPNQSSSGGQAASTKPPNATEE